MADCDGSSVLKHEKKKSGFTLLEMAIVMAITGTVIGVLFAASSVVQYRIYVNESVDVLGQINVNMHNAFAGRATSFAALGPPAVPDFLQTSFTDTFISQGIVPNDMLTPQVPPGTPPPAGTIANNPWNTGSAIGTIFLSLIGAAGNPVQFAVRYTNIGADACADLLVRTSLPGRETTLTRIDVGGNTFTSTAQQLPIDTITASGACPTAGAPFTIDWYFNLNG